jgi:hypothetical protein
VFCTLASRAGMPATLLLLLPPLLPPLLPYMHTTWVDHQSVILRKQLRCCALSEDHVLHLRFSLQAHVGTTSALSRRSPVAACKDD